MGVLISQDNNWFFIMSEISNVQIEKSRLDIQKKGISKCVAVWYVRIGCKDAKSYTVGQFYSEEKARDVIDDIFRAMTLYKLTDESTICSIPEDERKD